MKLASVATNTLGKSGRAMLEEIIAGQNDPEYLASLALGHLRAKTRQLRLALEGKIRPHHRFLLRRLLDQLRFVEHEIVLLAERLEDIGRERSELSQAVARWDTIPGLNNVGHDHFRVATVRPQWSCSLHAVHLACTPPRRQIISIVARVFILVLATAGSDFAEASPDLTEPLPFFHIAGNLYYDWNKGWRTISSQHSKERSLSIATWKPMCQ